MKLALLLAVVLGVAGCIAGSQEDLVSREAVTRAFNEAGEPVRLRLDMAVADPESPVDSLYVAKNEFEATAGPFRVVLLEDEHSAARHAVRLQARYGPTLYVVRERNVVLLVVPKVGKDRRMRLGEILKSL